jgi:hypothetical protein
LDWRREGASSSEPLRCVAERALRGPPAAAAAAAARDARVFLSVRIFVISTTR